MDNIPVAHRLTTLSGLSPTGSTEPTTIRNFICQKNRFANQTTKMHPVPLYGDVEVLMNQQLTTGGGMQLKTILNRVQKFKSFVYGKVRWVEDAKEPTIEVEIVVRKNSRPLCSVCGRPGPKQGTTPVRQFEFIPIWKIIMRNTVIYAGIMLLLSFSASAVEYHVFSDESVSGSSISASSYSTSPSYYSESITSEIGKGVRTLV
uniref:Zinc-finger of transposase IS204/IS1001/IS1096/IS1165 n=1 Tax=Candidatus Kentrum sp. SD TaxID=2126332 RepID=A0A450YBG8_9GAMM|nr:MAG: hypothetical protein BECKSD772F_GA0070984_10308 [Candidatus Kentron sp. SD]